MYAVEIYSHYFFAETCPQSWKYWNEKCYYISDNQQTFNISLDKCKEVDGEATLLSWHSQEEVDYVQGLILYQLLIQLPRDLFQNILYSFNYSP